jgi:hypothetical protein
MAPKSPRRTWNPSRLFHTCRLTLEPLEDRLAPANVSLRRRQDEGSARRRHPLRTDTPGLDSSSPTGADKTTPYVIGDSKGGEGYDNQTSVIQVAGSGADSSGGASPAIRFEAYREHQRPSLQLLNGRVYVAWASHSDIGSYHSWVVGFNATTLQPEKWFNTSPNARGAGIWQSQGALIAHRSKARARRTQARRASEGFFDFPSLARQARGGRPRVARTPGPRRVSLLMTAEAR